MRNNLACMSDFDRLAACLLAYVRLSMKQNVCSHQAQFEMPIFSKTHQSPQRWMPIAASIENVIQAVSMLESVKEQGPEVWLSDPIVHNVVCITGLHAISLQ